MKKNLKYNIIEDCVYQNDKGFMEVRIQNVTFSKILKDGTVMIHHARIITYVDIKKHKLVSLLTNDMESDPNEIIEIYHKRWEIELLFYDKYIVMRSDQKSTINYQYDRRILLRSTSHNEDYFFSPLSQSLRFLLPSQDLSESRLGVRFIYAFSRASRFAFESARA